MKIKLTIEYDGGKFFGWQKQKGQISVQESIENAVSRAFDNRERIELYGAGRTDAGVHATGQVAHFDVADESLVKVWKSNVERLPAAINYYLLDSGAVVIEAEVASPDFHARFSAKMRRYKYVIYNRKIKSVIYDKRAWHVARKLDAETMNAAAQSLLGNHNFNAFRSARCGAKNPIRTISEINISRKENFIIAEVAAKSFLHNQVRIIVGTLVKIGTGDKPLEYVEYLLDSQDRTLAGPTAPPHGLYLIKVEY
ncbi:MAG: tRNA pseudouridine(38-40) synthase TruA [Holosporales bacterium]|jgi:tRNA pseudouridine38-40 synthase|nr:tRNA pseudouridine(38-40) synthase TruA [Holosporales bacterium]